MGYLPWTEPPPELPPRWVEMWGGMPEDPPKPKRPPSKLHPLVQLDALLHKLGLQSE